MGQKKVGKVKEEGILHNGEHGPVTTFFQMWFDDH